MSFTLFYAEAKKNRLSSIQNDFHTTEQQTQSDPHIHR